MAIVTVASTMAVSAIAVATPISYQSFGEGPFPTAANPEFDSSVAGISCTSAVDCTAIGSYGVAVAGSNPEPSGYVAVETSSGWQTAVPDDVITGDTSTELDLTLSAISCTSADDCTAVGSGYGTVTDGDTDMVAISEVDGVWSTPDPIALPDTWEEATLDVISCTASETCTAAGTYGTTNASPKPFTVADSSGTWGTPTAFTLPVDASDYPLTQVNAITCVSSGSCAVVGQYEDATNPVGFVSTSSSGNFAEATEIDSPAGSGWSTTLNGVWCSDTSDCVAVGTYNDAGTTHGMATTETSGTWATAVATDSDSTNATLNDVTCSITAVCVAFGTVTDGVSADVVSISLSSEVWSAPTATTSFTVNDQPFYVTCVPNDCTVAATPAIGPDFSQAEATAWSGASFSSPTSIPIPSDHALEANGALLDVDCATTSACTTLGLFVTVGGEFEVYVTTYVDEVATSTRTLPISLTLGSSSYWGTVSCGAVGDCVVVVGGNGQSSFLDVESAGTWKAPVTVPSPESLFSVSCVGPSWCIAVGSDPHAYEIADTYYQEGFDEVDANGHWSSPTFVSGTTDLLGVSCGAVGDCEAVGDVSTYVDGYRDREAGVEMSGGRWATAVAVPPPSAPASGYVGSLDDVSCTSSMACLAVGQWSDSTSVSAVVAAATGKWSTSVVVTSPPDALQNKYARSEFSSVSCVDATDCVVVGTYLDSSGLDKVVEDATTVSGQRPRVNDIDSSTASALGPATPSAFAGGVACPAATTCFIVGGATVSGGGISSALPVVSFDGERPAPPTDLEALGHKGALHVEWAPSNGYGARVSTYVAHAGSQSCTTATTACTISGLTNGRTYAVTVVATSSFGTGDVSNSVRATPTAGTPVGPPGPVVGLTAVPKPSAVALTWKAPKDGGAGIADYQVCAPAVTATCTTTTHISAEVRGLTAHHAYRITVTVVARDGQRSRATAVTATAG